MAWTLNTDRPIYAQIVERLQKEILSGFYPAGSKLPSVRDLASVASVNPNTMQKAFAELEKSGLIITQRTSGRIVTEDIKLIKETQLSLAHSQLQQFLLTMKELGYNKDDIIAFLENTKMEDIK